MHMWVEKRKTCPYPVSCTFPRPDGLLHHVPVVEIIRHMTFSPTFLPALECFYFDPEFDALFNNSLPFFGFPYTLPKSPTPHSCTLMTPRFKFESQMSHLVDPREFIFPPLPKPGQCRPVVYLLGYVRLVLLLPYHPRTFEQARSSFVSYRFQTSSHIGTPLMRPDFFEAMFPMCEENA